MKKDIEWLKKEIGTEMIQLEPNRKERWSDVKYQTLRSVAQKINQLDEPEVLSHEWIRENQERKGIHFYVSVIKLQNLLVPKQEITFDQVHDKLREESILSEKSFDYYWNCINDNVEIDEPGNLIVPKQELPVIPKYVAEFIKSRKHTFENTFPYIFRIAMNNSESDIYKKEYDWIRQNYESFTKAWFIGYEVEEEALYYALVKGHELVDTGRVYWDYDKSDDSVFISELYSLPDNFLTEMSKSQWNELGINDSNADFVKAKG